MARKKRSRGPIVVAAGGTGGHLFPAQALAQELVGRGHKIHLMTDERVNRYADAFPAEKIHEIRSATFGLRKPLRILPGLWSLYRGYTAAKTIMSSIEATAVVGFGGYPTLPPLAAAVSLGLPTCIHEQNAVVGRANRILAPKVSAIAGTFDAPKRLAEDQLGKFHLTGNPVRERAKQYAGAPYAPLEPGGPFRMVVFGGSQGARVMSEVVPHAVAEMTAREGIEIVQQCREEDLEGVRSIYHELKVQAEVAPFFDDLPRRISEAHLVVSRAGASTVGELAVIGRPGILVPLPHSLDQDQRENALRFEDAGGGWLMDQSGFTPENLAKKLDDIRSDPAGLAKKAAGALSFGRPDAETALADLVEGLIAAR